MERFLKIKNHGLMLSILAVIFTLFSTCIDLLRWYEGFDIVPTIFSSYLKFIRTLIIAIIVWTHLKSKTEVNDIKLLKIGFFFIVVADAFLILTDLFATAIIFFAMMQIFLIYRHTPKYLELNQLKNKIFISLTFAVLFFVCFYLFSYPYLETHALKVPIFIYGALLVISCLSAYLSLFKHSFTSSQSTMIFCGMLLFLLCDITVLLPLILPNNSWAILARSMTGIFYTPALLLLAWSGIRSLTS
jgi:hypothetical protein